MLSFNSQLFLPPVKEKSRQKRKGYERWQHRAAAALQMSCAAGPVTRLPAAPGTAVRSGCPGRLIMGFLNRHPAFPGDLDEHIRCLQIHLFSESATSRSSSVDKEFLKQSSQTISAADSRCYPPAKGLEISYSRRGPLFPPVAMVMPQYRCCGSTASQRSHRTPLNQTICLTWHRFLGKQTPGSVKLS